VFPNPTHNEVEVDMSSLAGQQGQLSVFNQMGQLMFSLELEQITHSPIRLELDQLPTGVYHLMMIADGQIVGNEKVVKQ